MTQQASTIRIGTRGSALALWQANWVAGQIRSRGLQAEIIVLKTGGDLSNQPLNTMGGIGVFTKEIQRALLSNEVDVAVHSLKDLPTESVERLGLAVIPPRESPHDTLVTMAGKPDITIDDLPRGACVGTGSVRRRSQLLSRRSDLNVKDIRGNVDTRLKKLDDGEYDAIVLAEAGLRRLDLVDRIGEPIPLDQMVPAVGQGALGIETRTDDEATIQAIASLDHQPTHWSVCAERSLLAELLAGCLAPVGAYATWHDQQIEISAVVLSTDGQQKITMHEQADCNDLATAIEIGRQVARKLAEQGAGELISTARD